MLYFPFIVEKKFGFSYFMMFWLTDSYSKDTIAHLVF